MYRSILQRYVRFQSIGVVSEAENHGGRRVVEIRCRSNVAAIAENHEGRRVVVTGGTSGIGRAIANRFSDVGSTVFVGDVRKENDVDNITFVETDLSTMEGCMKLYDECSGQVDVLVNNCAVQESIPCHEMQEEEWKRILDINLTSYFRMSKLVLPEMMSNKSGVIINLASIQGLQSQPGVPAYAATKGACLSFTRQLAMEYAPYNIRAVSVCPGTIQTPLVEGLLRDQGKTLDDIRNDTLLNGGVGHVDDISELVLFLSSKRAKNITGEYVVCDGGMMSAGSWLT